MSYQQQLYSYSEQKIPNEEPSQELIDQLNKEYVEQIDELCAQIEEAKKYIRTFYEWLNKRRLGII